MLVPKSKRKSSKAGKEQTLRGTELRSRLASVSRTVEHLENTLQSLPRVDSRGGSDCPFTRELYARKEKLQASVSSSVAELRKYKVAIEKEITRCRKNLEHIGSAHGRVHTPDAVDALGDAEQAQRDELQSAISGRDAITLVLPRAEAALQVSTGRQYLGDSAGQEQKSAPRSEADPGGPDDSTSLGSQLGSELDDLFSEGPLT